MSPTVMSPTGQKSPCSRIAGMDWESNLTDWLSVQEARQAVEGRERRASTRQLARSLSLSGVDPEEEEDDPGARQICNCRDFRWVLEYTPRFRESAPGANVFSHMQEAWFMCVRMWDLGLFINHSVSPDGKTLYIKVGASIGILREEAALCGLKLRLRSTKGMATYSAEHRRHHLTTPNGTEFNSAQEQQLVMRRMNRSLLLDLSRRTSMPARAALLLELQVKLRDHVPISSRFLLQLFTTFGANVEEQAARIGPSTANAVRLVHKDPFFEICPGGRKRSSQCDKFSESLSATMQSMGLVGRTALMSEEGMARLQRDKYEAWGVAPLVWDDAMRIHRELTRWAGTEDAKGEGFHERFTGTLASFYATHDYDELRFFSRMWANPRIICMGWVEARPNEGRYTDGAYYNERNERAKQVSLFYQPVDEIRDYFGDSIALYFAWLGIYTKSLVWPSAMGVIILVGGTNPNENVFNVIYSLFIALWSVGFLQTWKRREVELRFLWGNEAVVASQKPRLQFEGKLKINLVTKRESEVVTSPWVAMARQIAAWLAISIFGFLVVACALGAETLSTLKPEWYVLFDDNSDGVLQRAEVKSMLDGQLEPLLVGNTTESITFSDFERAWVSSGLPKAATTDLSFGQLLELNKWVAISALVNLVVMQVSGFLFNKMAKRLNNWENYRLQLEYDRNMVLKSFVFQFVNNYFVMFYIAYLRQVDGLLGIGKAVNCDQSCLGQLQIKLFIVFTGKTYGMKTVEYGKPLLSRYLKRKSIDKATKGGEQQVSEGGSAGKANEFQLAYALQTQTPEQQAEMSTWESTFGDFAQMVIQFGYIALFGEPAFPISS
jgi:hypothetical protein